MRTQLFALLLLATTTTAFGQAGGINGPDQTGNSIPTIAEGEIPWDRFETAVTICYEQAANKLIKLMLGRELDLWSMDRGNGFGSRLSVYAANDSADGFSITGRFACGSDCNPQSDPNHAVILRPSDIYSFRPKFPEAYYQYETEINYYPYGTWGLGVTYRYYNTQGKGDDVATRLLIEEFPNLVANIVDRSVLSPIGQVLAEEKYVRTPHFVLKNSIDYSKLKISNPTTKFTVPGVTFDFNTVLNCMKTNIGN